MSVLYLMIGEVLRPQGVRGEVKVKPYAAEPEMFLDWTTLYMKEGESYVPHEAHCSRVHDGFAYVTLGDAQTREAAEALRGKELWIDRAHAAQLPEDAVYISELIGCKAVDEKGEEIGTLTDVLQYGSVDTYVFKTPQGSMMAPALKRVFTAVDIDAQVIRVQSDALAEVAVFED